MNDIQFLKARECERGALERMNYFPRQLITADDMAAEQEYFREKLRRHNRFLHGWGVVCGLEVSSPTDEHPWCVRISEGYALGPYGDEIYVQEPVCLDLAQCGPGAITDPCEPSLLREHVTAIGGELYIAIKYAECVARPVRAMPATCACEEDVCEYSRIRDSFELTCLTEQPPSYEVEKNLVCDFYKGQKLPPCPPCPTEPWVVLARVEVVLDAKWGFPKKMSIDNFVRRQIFSTAVLQEQVRKCCCEGATGVVVPVQQNADLCVEIKEANLDHGRRTIAYVIGVENKGAVAAEKVVLTSTVNAVGNGALASVEDFFPPNDWKKQNLPDLKAELGTVEKGTHVTLHFTIFVQGSEGPVTVKHVVTVESSTRDSDTKNNTDENTVTVGAAG